MRPRVLDLFSGAGGAAMGYHLAGFDVVGVDIRPQPRYPFEFVQGDALEASLDGFDLVHASPPCQAYSVTRHLPWVSADRHPRLIAEVRARLIGAGVNYVIENVTGARHSGDINGIELCGEMFGLPFIRHRVFESDLLLLQPAHPRRHRSTHRGRMFGDRLRRQPALMGLDWMTVREAGDAIPPAYTRFIGGQVMAALSVVEARA